MYIIVPNIQSCIRCTHPVAGAAPSIVVKRALSCDHGVHCYTRVLTTQLAGTARSAVTDHTGRHQALSDVIQHPAQTRQKHTCKTHLKLSAHM